MSNRLPSGKKRLHGTRSAKPKKGERARGRSIQGVQPPRPRGAYRAARPVLYGKAAPSALYQGAYFAPRPHTRRTRFPAARGGNARHRPSWKTPSGSVPRPCNHAAAAPLPSARPRFPAPDPNAPSENAPAIWWARRRMARWIATCRRMDGGGIALGTGSLRGAGSAVHAGAPGAPGMPGAFFALEPRSGTDRARGPLPRRIGHLMGPFRSTAAGLKHMRRSFLFYGPIGPSRNPGPCSGLRGLRDRPGACRGACAGPILEANSTSRRLL